MFHTVTSASQHVVEGGLDGGMNRHVDGSIEVDGGIIRCCCPVSIMVHAAPLQSHTSRPVRTKWKAEGDTMCIQTGIKPSSQIQC